MAKFALAPQKMHNYGYMNPVRANDFFYVYILRSLKDHKLYTGCASDLWARFKQHQEGKVVATKSRGPFEMLYYEGCTNKTDAFTREKYLKTGMGKRYLKNRLKRALVLTG